MSETPSGSERFDLRGPPVFGARLIGTVFVAVGFVLVLFARRLLAAGEGANLLALVALAAIIPSTMAVVGAIARRRLRATIEVHEDRIQLPRPGQGWISLRFSDLRSLYIRQRRRGGFLYLATEDREFVFPLVVFLPGQAERLHALLRTRLAALGPEGDRRLGRLDDLGRLADRAFSRRPAVTWAIAAAMAGIHAYLLATGHLQTVLDVASLGAVSPEIAAVTGPYVGLTAHWVHGWVFQPLLVLPALIVAGGMLERLLGHGVAALTLLGSAVAGGLAAAYFPGGGLHSGGLVMTAGAIGGLIQTAHLRRAELPVGFRLNGQWWTWVVTVTAVAGLVHGLSVPGVLVGLLAGVAVVTLTLDRSPEIPLPFSPRWTAWLAGGLIAAHAGAAVWAMEDLKGRGLELERLAVESHDDPRTLFEYAWHVEQLPNPKKDRLELALLAARRAVPMTDVARARLSVLDLESSLLERLGRASEAVDSLLGFLMDHPSAVPVAGRFARLLDAAHAEDGALLALAPLQPPALARFEVVRTATASFGRARLEPASERDRVLWSTLHSPSAKGEGSLAGLARIPIPAGATTATVALFTVEADAAVPDVVSAAPRLVVEGRASGKMWPVPPPNPTP